MISFKSDEWKLVVEELDKHLNNARSILENKETTPEDTAFYRGRIALAKELLRLPETLMRLSQTDNYK